MLIKLLYGACGVREGDIIVSKTSKSAPFEVEEKRGKQLIAMGYAMEIKTGYSQEREADVEAEEKADGPQEEVVKSLEEYSIQDLRKVAKEMNLSTAGSKQQLLNRIQAADAAKELTEEKLEMDSEEETMDKSEEEPPALTPAEPEV